MKQIIHSFYGSVPDLDTEAELRLSILWRERWSAIGFEPVILNSWIAQKHPYHKEFYEAICKLPSCNPTSYERFCYERWMALAQAGGGWMSDLDVFPTHHLTKELRTNWDKIAVFQAPCCPSFVACSKENAERLCLEFATANIGNRPQGERAHYSDQYAISDLVEHQKVDWIGVNDVVKQYPDPGWEHAVLIHFPNAALGPRGKTPKYKHIPQLLEEAKKA